MKRTFLVALTLLLCAACTVRAPQVDMARSAMSGGDRIDPGDFAWKMTFNDTEARLYAINVGGGIVFANEDGLEVAFDGWDVIVVSGMPGTLGMIRVDKREEPRVHHVQGLDAAFEVTCKEARRTASGWHVPCQHDDGDRVYTMDHHIDLSSGGRITRISASLIPGVSPMVIVPLFEIED